MCIHVCTHSHPGPERIRSRSGARQCLLCFNLDHHFGCLRSHTLRPHTPEPRVRLHEPRRPGCWGDIPQHDHRHADAFAGVRAPQPPAVEGPLREESPWVLVGRGGPSTGPLGVGEVVQQQDRHEARGGLSFEAHVGWESTEPVKSGRHGGRVRHRLRAPARRELVVAAAAAAAVVVVVVVVVVAAAAVNEEHRVCGRCVDGPARTLQLMVAPAARA